MKQLLVAAFLLTAGVIPTASVNAVSYEQVKPPKLPPLVQRAVDAEVQSWVAQGYSLRTYVWQAPATKKGTWFVHFYFYNETTDGPQVYINYTRDGEVVSREVIY